MSCNSEQCLKGEKIGGPDGTRGNHKTENDLIAGQSKIISKELVIVSLHI